MAVLRVGFLADDFFQLNVARIWGLDPFAAIADAAIRPGFLRPVGAYIIYQLPWHLWGYDPLPYHIVGLLTHATSALILAIWLSSATGRRTLGWLAGLLFAVFPFHLEAVGWVAVQYDSFAVLFGLASLWCFTLWWLNSRRWGLFLLSVLLYAFAIFTKESLLTFLPIFPLSAWLVSTTMTAREWRRLGYAMTPFGMCMGLNLGFRLLAWGHLGGYGRANTNYFGSLWDSSMAYVRLMLSPISAILFGKEWVQLVGLVSTVGLLTGLTLFGYKARRLLLVAGLWVALALIPVLNIAPVSDSILGNSLSPLVVPQGGDNLQQNRHVYLASAGYCVALSAIFQLWLASVRRWRPLVVGFIAAIILLSTSAAWLQLRPWHTASVQVNELVDGLVRLIPPQQHRPNGMVWFVENTPTRYKGAPVLYSGLGISRLFHSGNIDYPQVVRVADATQAPIANDIRDAFAMRFYFDEAAVRFWVDYGVGITRESPPSAPPQADNGSLVWDFTRCDPEDIDDWQVEQAQAECQRDAGLLLKPSTTDPQIQTSAPAFSIPTSGFKTVRIRTSMRYKGTAQPQPRLAEWFWKGPDNEYSAERVVQIPAKLDGDYYVYWLFLPAKDAGQVISGLRFDPINSQDPVELRWIAVDLVK
jgi:hypothetical protein